MAGLAAESIYWGPWFVGIEDDCGHTITIKTSLLPNDEQPALPMCFLLRGYESLDSKLIVVEDGLEMPIVAAGVGGGLCKAMI